MDIIHPLHTGAPVLPTAQPSPKVTADLRPAADAAAMVHDPRPAVSSTSILPARLAQLAEVSRSLIATAADEGPPAAQRAERVLKPWGVMMLPAFDDDAPQSTRARHRGQSMPDGG